MKLRIEMNSVTVYLLDFNESYSFHGHEQMEVLHCFIIPNGFQIKFAYIIANTLTPLRPHVIFPIVLCSSENNHIW